MERQRADPLRVVQACDLQAGGISSLILAICEELDRDQVNFDYLVYRDREEFGERRVRALGGRKLIADCEHAPNKAVKFLQRFWRTYRVLRRERARIFHVNASTPYECLVGAAGRLAGVETVILHAHNSRLKKDGRAHRLFQGLCRMCLPLCGDQFFACSNLARTFMFGARQDVVIIKNGVHTRRFRFDGAVRWEMRQRCGLRDELVVGCVGRLCPAKNHAFLLEIFSQLLSGCPDARLVLIGRGELEERLLGQAEALGLRERLIHIPATEQVERFYCMMDVFVLPSLFEGLPVVGVEAQAAGLPCLFSDTITREVGITGRASFLSLDDPPAAWAALAASQAEACREGREIYADQVAAAGFEIRARMLESVLAQSYPQVEMILMDDGSTDHTLEIAHSYADRFARRGYGYQVLHGSHQNASAAINRGLALVEGEYLIWPDSDDVLAPASIARRVAFLEAHPQYSCVRSLMHYFNDTSCRMPLAEAVGDIHREDLFFDMIEGRTFVCCGCYMLRTETFFSIYPQRRIPVSPAGQNFQMLLPFMYRYRCPTLPEPLYGVCLHPEGHSRRQRTAEEERRRYRDFEQLMDEIRRICGANGLFVRRQILCWKLTRRRQLARQQGRPLAAAWAGVQLFLCGRSELHRRLLPWLKRKIDRETGQLRYREMDARLPPGEGV